MELKFSHVQGYSGVDHFGAEIVSLCERIAAEQPRPDGLWCHTDHILDDYRKMVAHGRTIVREALSRFRPCVDYSGPSLATIRIKVSVTASEKGYLVPPLVAEDNLSILREYTNEYKNVPLKDATEWRNRWVATHPECSLSK
jgi:hypothetical protein